MKEFLKGATLALKQWYYRWFVLPRMSREELYALIRQPDPDIQMEVRRAFIRQLTSISQLMVIVYDDCHEHDEATRLWAGRCALRIASLLSPDFVPRSCYSWIDPEQGRLAYLVGVGLYLPQLRDRVIEIVLGSLTLREQWAFERLPAW